MTAVCVLFRTDTVVGPEVKQGKLVGVIRKFNEECAEDVVTAQPGVAA